MFVPLYLQFAWVCPQILASWSCYYTFIINDNHALKRAQERYCCLNWSLKSLQKLMCLMGTAWWGCRASTLRAITLAGSLLVSCIWLEGELNYAPVVQWQPQNAQRVATMRMTRSSCSHALRRNQRGTKTWTHARSEPRFGNVTDQFSTGTALLIGGTVCRSAQPFHWIGHSSLPAMQYG